MDIFEEEIMKFLRELQENNVRYIMVGGYAINLHGLQRYTGDIDIWIEDTEENRENLRKAFIKSDVGDFYMLKTMQFVPGWTYFHLNNGMRLDVMVTMKGLEEFSFDECLQMASIADIDDVRLPFLQINQLIANKKAVNRPKDQLDVIELEKIKKLLEDDGQK